MSPAGKAYEQLNTWRESGQKLQLRFEGSVTLNLSRVSLRLACEQQFDFVGEGIEFIWHSTFGLAVFSLQDGVVTVSSGDDRFIVSVSQS